MPRFVYAPGAGDAPAVALPCGVRADQTGLALFFFLRLGGQTRLRGSARISGTLPARVYRRAVPPCGGTRRRAGRTWANRNTTRKPMSLFRLSG
ncbi:MAG: hypothetical protein ACREVK_01555 [Gammaproteobacteria bacterium]